MAWTELLVNPNGIRSIFGEDAPSLKSVELIDLTFSRDGPTLKARIDLADFPASPPSKWLTQRFNTVQIELSFLEVRDVYLRGFGVMNSVDVLLDSADPLRFAIRSAGMEVEGAATALYLSRISAYQDESSG